MSEDMELRFKGRVERTHEALTLLNKPGDAALVERGRPRLLLLACPCGCGEKFPINLDSRAGKAWRLYRAKDGKISVYPSVWRDGGCGSHYIIWRGKILLFGEGRDDYDDAWLPSAELTRDIKKLPLSTLTDVFDISDALDAIPWDVLSACRRLVRTGVLIEGKGPLRGKFRRAPSHTP